MKPLTRKAKLSPNLLQSISVGPVVAKIEGSVKKQGQQYKDATIVLYNKANFLPLTLSKPNENGDYQFLGLNNLMDCFVVALDSAKQYNAVIQDNVVPK